MHRAASAVSLGTEAYGSEGPRWVVAQAEAELVTRYGDLDGGELGLTAAMFDPPIGAFLVARAEGEPDPVGGVGVRTVADGVGEVRRLWGRPRVRRGLGIGRLLAMTGLEAAARDLGAVRARPLPHTEIDSPRRSKPLRSAGWERLRVDVAGEPLPTWHIRFSKIIT